MTWYERVIDAHTAVTDQVSHGSRLRSSRYFVWTEDGSNDLAGDDDHAESAVTGTTDLYSKVEFDPWSEALGRSFDRAGIAWSLVLAEYEEETGLWHWSWDWEVA